MTRSLVFFTIFWLVLLITIPLVIPVHLFSLVNADSIKKAYVRSISSVWARFTLFTAGIKLILNGKENIPTERSGYAIISNHQGTFDIPVFVAVLPFSPGFIAKKELMKFPFIRSWMRALECLPIDRKDAKKAREKILRRICQKGKNPLVLFPEGTRSRSKQTGNFRTGSLKLLFHNQLDILPATIDGTYKAYEEQKRIRPAEVKITFHPILRTSSYKPGEFSKFVEDLRNTISGELILPMEHYSTPYKLLRKNPRLKRKRYFSDLILKIYPA